MKKIENFMLPQHHNNIFKDEAISSISLTRDIANKINELVAAYNELSQMDVLWKQTVEGKINSGVVYMKDNLLNSIHNLFEILLSSGKLDEMIPNSFIQSVNSLNYKTESIVSVKEFGAVGDGINDDTLAIQNAINSVDSGVIHFPSGSYKHGEITINNKENLVLDGNNTKHIIEGTNCSAFLFTGTNKNVILENFVIEGNQDKNSMQIGISSPSGVSLENVAILHNTISGCVVGIAANADLAGHLTNVFIENNTIINAVGTEVGTGYGIHAANGNDEYSNVKITHNTLIGCERHSIYIARGRGFIVSGNYIADHRKSVYDGNARCALQIARSSIVTADNNIFENCYDGYIMVIGGNVSTEGYPMDSYPAKDIIISNNILKGSTNISALWVGYISTADGIPENIKIVNNIFDKTGIDVKMGIHVDVTNNTFIVDKHNALILECILNEDGTSSNDYYSIRNNDFHCEGSYKGIRLQPTFTESEVNTIFDGNSTDGGDLFNCGSSVTNPNITLIGDNSGYSSNIRLKKININDCNSFEFTKGSTSIDLFIGTSDGEKTINFSKPFSAVPNVIIMPENVNTSETNEEYKENQMLYVSHIVTAVSETGFTIKAHKNDDGAEKNTVACYKWVAIN